MLQKVLPRIRLFPAKRCKATAAPSSVPAAFPVATEPAHHLSGLNGLRVSRSASRPARPGTTRRFVTVRELKRHLIAYAWVIALRELLRIPRIPVEIRRGLVILAGLLTSPLVISEFAWWILTGKHLPGPPGAWLHDPAVVRVNMFRKLPATILEGSTASGPTQE